MTRDSAEEKLNEREKKQRREPADIYVTSSLSMIFKVL